MAIRTAALRWCVLTVLALLSADGAAQQPEDVRAVGAFLDAVGRGDRVSLAFELNNQFQLVFEKAARAWVDAGGPKDRERRDRVVAVAVLIAARDAIGTPPTWDAIKGIVEWQCNRLRHGAPSEFEHTWMLASIAIIEGASDLAFLGSSDIEQCRNKDVGRPCNHVLHASARFPQESRFKLAALMSRVELNVFHREPGILRNPISGFRWPRGGLEPKEAIKRAPETESRLRELAADRTVGAEASLELGIMFYNLGDLDRSLIELATAASRSKDRYVRHLAWFTTGLARDAQGRPNEALSAYEAAIQAEPSVASSALWLGAKYFAAGRQADAFDVVDRAFDDPEPAADPWHRRHDYRFWPIYLADLQERVRR